MKINSMLLIINWPELIGIFTGVSGVILSIFAIVKERKTNRIQRKIMMMDKLPFFMITREMVRHHAIGIEITNIGQLVLDFRLEAKNNNTYEIMLDKAEGEIKSKETRNITIRLNNPPVKEFSFQIKCNSQYKIELTQTINIMQNYIKISRPS